MTVTVDARLARLETNLRTWRIVSGVALVTAALALLWRPAATDDLSQERIVLADGEGSRLELDPRGLTITRPGAQAPATLASLRFDEDKGGGVLELRHSDERGGTIVLLTSKDGTAMTMEDSARGRSLLLGAGKRQAGLHVEGRDASATATLRIAGIDSEPDDDVELVLASRDDVEPITLNPEDARLAEHADEDEDERADKREDEGAHADKGEHAAPPSTPSETP